jgi:hypothetical protein
MRNPANLHKVLPVKETDDPHDDMARLKSEPTDVRESCVLFGLR